MKRWRLNTITARIALTLVLAIILGIALTVGVNYIDTRFENPPPQFFVTIGWFKPTSNFFAVSAKVATIARIAAQASEVERPRIIAAMTDPSLELMVRDTPLPNLSNGGGARLDQLRELVELQLGGPAGTVIVGMGQRAGDRFGAAETRTPAGSSAPVDALVEIALPDGHWLVARLFDYPAHVAWLHLALALAPLFIAIGLMSMWTAGRLAAPIRAFAAGAERLGKGTDDAPALAEQGPYELRTAVDAFNRMQERLRRFVNDRTQMVAAISHDLKTPLTRLRLRAEFVGDEEQQRRMLADLDEMTAMIESTLAFARDDAQREPRMLVDLGALLGSVCDNASDTGGAVSFTAPRGLDVTCRPSAISRAVTNLIDNAVKYGREGTEIEVTARPAPRRPAMPPQIAVAVRDHGEGIRREHLPRLTERFYRVDTARSRAMGGTGLGLAIVKHIVNRYRGMLEIESEVGEGSVFTVYLRAAAEEAALRH